MHQSLAVYVDYSLNINQHEDIPKQSWKSTIFLQANREGKMQSYRRFIIPCMCGEKTPRQLAHTLIYVILLIYRYYYFRQCERPYQEYQLQLPPHRHTCLISHLECLQVSYHNEHPRDSQ